MAPPEQRYRHAACNDSAVPHGREPSSSGPGFWTGLLPSELRSGGKPAAGRGRRVTIGRWSVPIWPHWEWAEPADTPLLGTFIFLLPFPSVETYACFSPPDIYSSNATIWVWDFTAFPILLSSLESELTETKPQQNVGRWEAQPLDICRGNQSGWQQAGTRPGLLAACRMTTSEEPQSTPPWEMLQTSNFANFSLPSWRLLINTWWTEVVLRLFNTQMVEKCKRKNKTLKKKVLFWAISRSMWSNPAETTLTFPSAFFVNSLFSTQS